MCMVCLMLSFVIFSYGPIMKSLKISLLWRKQKGSAITRRFVIPLMFDYRKLLLWAYLIIVNIMHIFVSSLLQVIVTETSQNLSFWAQHVDSGKLLNMGGLRCLINYPATYLFVAHGTCK